MVSSNLTAKQYLHLDPREYSICDFQEYMGLVILFYALSVHLTAHTQSYTQISYHPGIPGTLELQTQSHGVPLIGSA